MSEFKFTGNPEKQIAIVFRNRLRVVGEFITTEAKKYAPVDSGRLRDSISWKLEGFFSLIIFTNVEYARWVELGTRNQAPQPFLYPALFNFKARILSLLRQ